MPLTESDIQKIAQTVDQVTGPRFTRLEERLQSLEAGQNNLVTSIDQMLAIVRRHEEEWLVLRAQHAKIRDLLLRKGIATEDELAVA
jgi:hypothetical protein